MGLAKHCSKSSSWLYQRINGNSTRMPAKFTAQELKN
ncbi:MAG: DUF5053 domain-containing protein [Butyricimonas paravirosa]